METWRQNPRSDQERQCSLFNLEGIGNGILGVKGRTEVFLPHGGVAQLGEHLPCKQGVRSSTLLISTNVGL